MRALSPTYAHRAAAAAARGGIPVGRGRSVRAGSIGADGVDRCGRGRFRVMARANHPRAGTIAVDAALSRA